MMGMCAITARSDATLAAPPGHPSKQDAEVVDSREDKKSTQIWCLSAANEPQFCHFSYPGLFVGKY